MARTKALGVLWGLGLIIRLWDVFVYRPACVPGQVKASCYNLAGDSAGFFGAAQLVRLGKVGFNPLLYNVTGGRLVATAAKPPIGVGWLAFLSWMGDSPWMGQLVVAVLLIAASYLVVQRVWGRARALLVAEIQAAVFLALRIVDGTNLTTVRVFSVLLASLSIPLMSAVARRAAPEGWADRVGLVTAAIVAIHPAIWVGDSMLNNETVLVVALPLFLLACYHVLDRPGWLSWTLLGTAMSALMLTRVELASLAIIVVPFLVVRAVPDWRGRLRSGATFGLTLLLLMGIYSGWNQLRLGSGSPGPVSVIGYVLNAGSCDRVFSGGARGLWFPCWVEPQTAIAQPGDQRVADVVDRIVDHPGFAEQLTDPDVGVLQLTQTPPPLELFDGYEQLSEIRPALIGAYGELPDGSPGVGMWIDGQPTADPDAPVSPGDEIRFRHHFYFLMTNERLTAEVLAPPTRTYLSEHRDEIPGVMLARLGRITGVYKTVDTMGSDQLLEAHGWFPSRFGFIGLWLQVPFAVLGALVLRRHRRPLAPLLGPILNVMLVTMVVFGLARYRLSADLPLAVLAAVGLVATLRRFGPDRHRNHAPDRQLASEPHALVGDWAQSPGT